MFRVFPLCQHSAHSAGPKVRFSAGSAWYVRRTSVYVRNTFRAYKKTNSSRLEPLQQRRQRCCIRSQKKWTSIRAVLVASRRQRQPVLCRRCVDQPCCKVCKRRLPAYCFDDVRARVCQACVRKLKKPRILHAVDEIVQHIEIPGDSLDATFEDFIDRNRDYINREIDDRRRRFGSIRVVFRVFTEFSRQVDDEIQHVDGQFNLRPQLVADGHDLNFDELVSEMIVSVDNFNARGSGFVLDRIKNCVIVITSSSGRLPDLHTYLRRHPSSGKKPSSTLKTKTSGASNGRFFQVCTHQKVILRSSTVTLNIETP